MATRTIDGFRFTKAGNGEYDAYRADVQGQHVWAWNSGDGWAYGFNNGHNVENDVNVGFTGSRDGAIRAAISVAADRHAKAVAARAAERAIRDRIAAQHPVLVTAEHRGIRIVVQSKPDAVSGTTFIATAGGRSFIANATSTPQQAVREAIYQIDNVAGWGPEKIALWLNDTTHWLAAQKRGA